MVWAAVLLVAAAAAAAATCTNVVHASPHPAGTAGTMMPVQADVDIGPVAGLAVTDVDNDGVPELVVADSANTAIVAVRVNTRSSLVAHGSALFGMSTMAACQLSGRHNPAHVVFASARTVRAVAPDGAVSVLFQDPAGVLGTPAQVVCVDVPVPQPAPQAVAALLLGTGVVVYTPDSPSVVAVPPGAGAVVFAVAGADVVYCMSSREVRWAPASSAAPLAYSTDHALVMTLPAAPAAVAVADLDADGHDDVVVAAAAGLWLATTTFPSAGFAVQQLELPHNMASVLQPAAAALAFICADVDTDGDPDIVASYSAGGGVWLLHNNAGMPWTATALPTRLSTPTVLAAGDFYGTGRPSVFVAQKLVSDTSTYGVDVLLPPPQSGAVFPTAAVCQLLPPAGAAGAVGAPAVAMAPWANGKGWVAAAADTDDVWVHPAVPPAVNATPALLAAGPDQDRPVSIAVGDLDGQGGANDVLVASYASDTVHAVLQGNASRPLPVVVVVTTACDGCIHVDALDVDGDGAVDCVAVAEQGDLGEFGALSRCLHLAARALFAIVVPLVTFHTVSTRPRPAPPVMYFRNDGFGGFVASPRVIAAPNGPTHLAAATISGSPALAVAYFGRVSLFVAPAFDEQPLVSSAAGGFKRVALSEVAVGAVDLVFSTTTTLAWLPLDGAGRPLQDDATVIAEGVAAGGLFAVTDVDEDGLQDVVAVLSTSSVVWWRNSGRPAAFTSSPAQVVATVPGTVTALLPLPASRVVLAALHDGSTAVMRSAPLAEVHVSGGSAGRDGVGCGTSANDPCATIPRAWKQLRFGTPAARARVVLHGGPFALSTAEPLVIDAASLRHAEVAVEAASGGAAVILCDVSPDAGACVVVDGVDAVPVTLRGLNVTATGGGVRHDAHAVLVTGQSTAVSLQDVSFTGFVLRGGHGGAALAVRSQSQVSLQDVHFRNCSAHGGAGGAVFVDGQSSVLASSVAVSGCSAERGGAVAVLDGAALHAVGVTMHNCSAHGGAGGAVFVDGQSSVLASSVAVSGCSAERGGAVAVLDGAALHAVGVTMHNCSAAEDGGAVFARHAVLHLLSDVSIAHCVAGRHGGALAATFTPPDDRTPVTANLTAVSAGDATSADGLGHAVWWHVVDAPAVELTLPPALPLFLHLTKVPLDAAIAVSLPAAGCGDVVRDGPGACPAFTPDLVSTTARGVLLSTADSQPSVSLVVPAPAHTLQPELLSATLVDALGQITTADSTSTCALRVPTLVDGGVFSARTHRGVARFEDVGLRGHPGDHPFTVTCFVDGTPVAAEGVLRLQPVQVQWTFVPKALLPGALPTSLAPTLATSTHLSMQCTVAVSAPDNSTLSASSGHTTVLEAGVYAAQFLVVHPPQAGVQVVTFTAVCVGSGFAYAPPPATAAVAALLLEWAESPHSPNVLVTELSAPPLPLPQALHLRLRSDPPVSVPLEVLGVSCGVGQSSVPYLTVTALVAVTPHRNGSTAAGDVHVSALQATAAAPPHPPAAVPCTATVWCTRSGASATVLLPLTAHFGQLVGVSDVTVAQTAAQTQVVSATLLSSSDVDSSTRCRLQAPACDRAEGGCQVLSAPSVTMHDGVSNAVHMELKAAVGTAVNASARCESPSGWRSPTLQVAAVHFPLCGRGTQPVDNATRCAACAPGSASATGAGCVPCAAGTVAPASGAEQCTACGFNTFADAQAPRQRCTPCPHRLMFTVDNGTAADNGCLCPPGFHRRASACVQCAIGANCSTPGVVGVPPRLASYWQSDAAPVRCGYMMQGSACLSGSVGSPPCDVRHTGVLWYVGCRCVGGGVGCRVVRWFVIVSLSLSIVCTSYSSSPLLCCCSEQCHTPWYRNVVDGTCDDCPGMSVFGALLAAALTLCVVLCTVAALKVALKPRCCGSRRAGAVQPQATGRQPHRPLTPTPPSKTHAVRPSVVPLIAAVVSPLQATVLLVTYAGKHLKPWPRGVRELASLAAFLNPSLQSLGLAPCWLHRAGHLGVLLAAVPAPATLLTACAVVA